MAQVPAPIQISTELNEFPYAAKFLPPPEQMYQNLRDYRPEIIGGRAYRLSSYYPKFNLFSTKYGNRFLFIQVEDEKYYFRIDGLTDLFNEKARITSRKIYAKSAQEIWLSSYEELKGLPPAEARELIYQRGNEPGLFRLTWIKGIYSIIFPLLPKNRPVQVLDFSAGWGDRLIGSILMNWDYLGFDPNLALAEGHQQIVKLFGNSNRHQIIYEPFESSEYPIGERDLIFTSPPFFNLEIYDNAPTQSIVRYSTFRIWFWNFLFVSLRKAWYNLRDGGLLVLHLGDTREVKLCEPTNLLIEEQLPGSEYCGVIGVSGWRGKHSPVWVWKKNNRVNYSRRRLQDYYPELVPGSK